jgi:LacI family transcriptional regulator
MASLSMPVVLVDRDLPGIRSAVLADHAGGIAQAAAHLIGLGHRSIALVNGDLKVRPSRERASALRRACRAAGVTAVVRNGSFDAEHGHRATGALLDAAAPPTAVIAGSNQILVGVLRAVRERGLAVPTDVSLVTCDDIALTEFLDPALATIRRDTRGMGRASAELLLDLIDGGAPRTQTLETSFAAKESCAAPPRGPR